MSVMLKAYLIVGAVLSWHGKAQKIVKEPDFVVNDNHSCPQLSEKVYKNSKVTGGSTANENDATRLEVPNIANLSSCVEACCKEIKCHVSLMYDGKCYMISCLQDSFCLPTSDPSGAHDSSLVLVRTPSGNPWSSSLNSTDIPPEVETTLSSEASSKAAFVCEVGLDAEQCRSDEICQQNHDKSRAGTCQCKVGTVRDQSGACVDVQVPTPSSLPIKITVYVENKTVTLPQSSVSLSVVTSDDSNTNLKYVWESIELPDKGQSAIEKGAHNKTLVLSNLVEGVYLWKVTVTSSNPAGYGATVSNVTVLPAARINTPPKAAIKPEWQTITLPTNKAILDGSVSTDDTTLKSFLWELVSGPVGYQPKLDQQSVLTLSDLTVGNYTLQLTVTDEDGETDTSTASLEVVKDADYKPKAVAGEDIVLYLPENSVTLNGSQSTDDHGIVTWEWTKVKEDDDEDLPADISGARTALMTVSNLQQGQYKFNLKVTDESGQSDEDDVKVYVKPPTNNPPTAKAGDDMDLSLPLPFLTLDGTGSHDDGNITTFAWSLISAPDGFNAPVIVSPDAALTNVTGLGVGSYNFQLLVVDNSGSKSSDNVMINVKQDTNQAPVANPGSNVKIQLPVNEVMLDGSSSSDDLAVVRWTWSRDLDSLAAGNVIGNMSGPQLYVTDLIPGIYSFNLHVADAQGLTSNKSVKVTVLEDPGLMNVVELVLERNLSHFKQNQKSDVLDSIRVLSREVELKGELSVADVSISSSPRQGLATLHFKVFALVGGKRDPVSGMKIVTMLKEKLKADPILLAGVPVSSIDTLVCQNTCSGHGTCNQATRECICDAAWTENFFSRRFTGAEPNCEWSLVYVGLASGICLLFFIICCCLTTCKRKVVKMRAKRKYSRLTTNDNVEMTDVAEDSSMVQSESDSEEEVLFESTKKGRKTNGFYGRTGNGFLKNGKHNA